MEIFQRTLSSMPRAHVFERKRMQRYYYFTILPNFSARKYRLNVDFLHLLIHINSAHSLTIIKYARARIKKKVKAKRMHFFA
jgi:hypothetical protein